MRSRQTVAQQEAEEAKAQTGAGESKEDVTPATKQFAGFLSHYKHECGTEARLVHNELKELLPDHHNALFLDSDDLNDLRLLLQAVKDTEVLVLLQSKGVLTVGRFQTYTTEHPDINTDLRTRSVRMHLPTQPNRTNARTNSPAQPRMRERTPPSITHTQRPWVILELYTAITNNVPVVALNVNNASAYDYGDPHNIHVKFPM